MINRNLLLATSIAILSVSNVEAYYSGSLAFIEPSGTVTTSETIPVWIRLTLDQNSEPLVLTNSSDTPPFGVNPSNYPTGFYYYDNATNQTQNINGQLTVVNNISINTWFGCSGTFTSSCDPGAYSFDFNSSGPNSINFLNNFSLQPGESFDYLFGTFTPTASIAPGTYEFYSSGLSLDFQGTVVAPKLDANGDPVLIPAVDDNGDPILDDNGDPTYVPETITVFNADSSFHFATTACPNQENQVCAASFNRTVVPLPSAFWLFGSALLGLSGYARKIKR